MSRFIVVGCTGLWLSAIAVGIWRVESYANTPGISAESRSDWPGDSALTRASMLPTLVMFVHPRCPCSRASLGELHRLYTRFGDRVAIAVSFVVPADSDGQWLETDLYRSATAIPGATVWRDIEGIEAARFGAKTSGQTMLFAGDGTLLFTGGITSSRGHHGDNAGRMLVEHQLEHPSGKTETFSVFGCGLFVADEAGPDTPDV